MSSEKYTILFAGKTREGVSPETAKGNLKKLLKANDQTIERLFSGKSFAIKKDLDREQVDKYISVLYKAGVLVSTDKPLTDEISPAPAPAAPQKATPQTKGAPKAKSKGVLIAVIAGVVVFVVILGILAAIAIPAYQEYTLRARVALAIFEANQTRDEVAHFMLANGAIPNSNREAGLPENIATENLSSVVVMPGAVMQATFKAEDPVINGKTIVWVPEFEGNRVSWDCSGGTLAGKYRTTECLDGKYQGEQIPNHLRQYVSLDGLVEVTVPKTWGPEELAEGATLELGNLFTENYLMVFTQPKAGVPNHDLSSFGVAVRDFMSGNLGNPKAKYVGSNQINGNQALHYRIEGRIDGIDATYLLTVVEGKENYFQVITWTLSERFQYNESKLRAAIASFKEKKR